jgi:hypothetical protein
MARAATDADARAHADQKLSVSFAPELAELIRHAADAEESVAAWMAEAARHRLRLDAMRAALEAFEAGHGPITDEKPSAAGRVRPTSSTPMWL